MSGIGVPEVAGIGGVALGFGTLFWWIFKAMVEVVEKNAEMASKLSNTVENLQKSIEANTTITRSTNDVFSTALATMLTKRK